jgi:hypothetical protein
VLLKKVSDFSHMAKNGVMDTGNWYWVSCHIPMSTVVGDKALNPPGKWQWIGVAAEALLAPVQQLRLVWWRHLKKILRLGFLQATRLAELFTLKSMPLPCGDGFFLSSQIGGSWFLAFLWFCKYN